MKKGILALFLSLTLVLSYAPLTAFADTEAEGASSINELDETAAVVTDEHVQIEEEAEEADKSVLTEAEAEEADKPVLTEAEAEEREQPAEELSQKEALTAAYGTDPEECSHEYTYKDKDWDPDEVYYEIIDDEYHRVEGPGYIVTRCEDCEAELDREGTQIMTNEEHCFADGVCIYCHHENNCAHENVYTDEFWDPDEVDYEIFDDECHKVIGRGVKETWCEDCGEVFESIDIQVSTKEEHYYDDSVCLDCGHTCKHTSTYYEYDYDSNKCAIEYLGDGKLHHVTGSIYRDKWCEYCDALLEEKYLGYTTVTEEHDYDDNSYECYLCGYPIKRVYGDTRYETAIEAAEQYKESTASKFRNVIVAYGEKFPDALSGGYLAKVKNAPILLVKPEVESRIIDYISKNIKYGGTVYILGGTGVVSESFEAAVKNKGIETERLGGADRYETNLKILNAAGITNQEILVCTGENYPDSLSASATRRPILLVKDTLTEEQQTYIKSLSTEQFYLIGGEAIVTSEIETGLKDLGYSNIERLWGATRYETSTAVAKKFFQKAVTVVLAIGNKFPDGLSGGPMAMVESAPILLATSTDTKAAKEYVKTADVVRSITLGGPALISDIAVKAIMGI